MKGVDEDEWERLEARMEMRWGARVVGLPGLLDLFARSWVLTAREGGDGREAAGFLVWILGQLVEKEEVVNRWEVPNVIGEEFWSGFTEMYPGVGGLLGMIGLQGPDGRF